MAFIVHHENDDGEDVVAAVIRACGDLCTYDFHFCELITTHRDCSRVLPPTTLGQ